MTFSPPINSIQYLLRHAVDFRALQACPTHADLSDELASDILAGASAFASDVLAPINRAGDEYGATLKDGVVTTAPGFKEAYKAYTEAGWQGLSAPEEFGGMELPMVMSVAVSEMLYGANMAFGLAPMLTGSAMNAIFAHAADELKNLYLPKMVSGEWSGGMNLTEPQAGSDLGVLRTKATPNSDGSYALSGQKIFITWGDHDCTDNIVHLVLARLPDAPAGSRGISLFLAPKFLLDEDGYPGAANGITAIGLEHKLGIHASPTCVMEFAGAKAWLVGPENKGLACMFTMMNEARLFVGVQGVGIGERAFQAALAYAGERVQGRVAGAEPGAPISGHADVRRMLMDMKAGIMGARAINLACAYALDMSEAAPDEAARKAAHARQALLTPIAKAYGSDMGVAVTSTGVQVHGGMGFIEETGAAQHYRDARIAPIYEGTNGIQALDLVGRKLRRDGGAAMSALIADIDVILVDAKSVHGSDGLDLGCNIRHLEAGIAAMKSATDMVVAMDDIDSHAAAVPYLELCGHVISGALLITSVVSGLKAKDPHAPAMQKLVWYHSLKYLAQAPAHLEQIKYAAAPVFAYPEDRLADL
ncbi:MAG: acyl-CoA dehydrogenase family protein [Robiginitomaculum sp.]|nr:acyl-CoA dehydrogenase family protein [Robiginitomaculum sp.]